MNEKINKLLKQLQEELDNEHKKWFNKYEVIILDSDMTLSDLFKEIKNNIWKY